MKSALHYHTMVSALRQFFKEKKGFIEVPAQSRTSILAACEDPSNVTNYNLNNVIYPLPQTGQMWLEHELLLNPQWPGVFCITTSYRDEPNPIEGRHWRIFPMFEFESHGTFADLQKIEQELLTYLGFQMPISIEYEDACKKYESQFIESSHEVALAHELGSAISLEHFPARTQPFWNMKYIGNGLFNKIDILLHGMETIGSAERETDTQLMRDQFMSISNGKYAELLFKFGKERVIKELDEYLSLDFFPRFGAGIGLNRLERAYELSGLFAEQNLIYPPCSFTTPTQIQI
jgi:tRNA synthetases class II (D, K and N)